MRATVTALVAVALTLAACGSSSSTSTSHAAAPGVTSSQILFGQTCPESGPAALYGETTAGVVAYFDMTNARGGIKGRKLKLVTLNDKYEPPVSLQDTRTLVYTDHVFAEVASVGSATTKADLTVLDPQNVPDIGPQTGANFVYFTFHKNVYNVWPSYVEEGKLLGAFAATHHYSKVGVLYQDDSFGKSLYQGVRESGLKVSQAISYDPSQTDFSPQAEAFKTSGVDAVIILAIPGPTTDFLNAMAAINFKPARIMTEVAVIPSMFSTSPTEFPGSYIGAFIPPLHNSQNPQVKTFLSAMAKYQPGKPASMFAAQGWTDAQVVVAGLEKIKGPVTRTDYETALNSLTNLSTLGGSLSYTSSSHHGLHHMFMVQGLNGHRVPVTG
jgi:ABC-type branched-subunit amino acid transport system substrate-binding protein